MEVYRMEDGWRKVSEKGGSYVTALLYNVVTGESASLCVRDYDYQDCSRDCDFWYYAPVDKAAYEAYCRKNAIIYPGASVMVIKGRKIPLGTVAMVESIKPISDRYGRCVADYAVFTDGRSTNINNCIMIL